MPEDDHASLEDDSRLDLARMRYRAALFFVITCVLSLFLLERTADHRAHEAKALAAEVGHAHLRLVSERLNASFSATYALAALVRQGRGQIEDFTRTAGDLLQLYRGGGALQRAPGGVIREVVPLLGNERAIGHDLLADPQRSGEALLAVGTRKLTLAGPFELMQGGLGAVARLPVCVPQAGGGDRFWGFTTVLVRFPEILAGTGLERLPKRHLKPIQYLLPSNERLL